MQNGINYAEWIRNDRPHFLFGPARQPVIISIYQSFQKAGCILFSVSGISLQKSIEYFNHLRRQMLGLA